MKKAASQELPPSPSNTKGTKDKIWLAFVHLSDAVSDLMDLHEQVRGDTKISISTTKFGLDSTNAYTTHIQEVATALLSLGDQLKLRQSGGPNRKSDINVTYAILKAHYIDTGKILTAPALVAQYNMKLYGQKHHVKENGNEELSEKVARGDIRMFKLCLPHEDFCRN